MYLTFFDFMCIVSKIKNKIKDSDKFLHIRSDKEVNKIKILTTDFYMNCFIYIDKIDIRVKPYKDGTIDSERFMLTNTKTRNEIINEIIELYDEVNAKILLKCMDEI